MARADTARFSEFLIQLGDGASPEVFEQPCGRRRAVSGAPRRCLKPTPQIAMMRTRRRGSSETLLPTRRVATSPQSSISTISPSG